MTQAVVEFDQPVRPEVECIGKSKARAGNRLWVRVDGDLTPLCRAILMNTLATATPAMEDMIGNTIERLLADAGYRGHNAPTDYKFRVYTSGQKRRLTPQIKRPPLVITSISLLRGLELLLSGFLTAQKAVAALQWV